MLNSARINLIQISVMLKLLSHMFLVDQLPLSLSKFMTRSNLHSDNGTLRNWTVPYMKVMTLMKRLFAYSVLAALALI